MGKFIDFAALRERLPIDEVADMLPVKWERKGEQLRTTCPVHGGDRGLIVTPSKGLFVCQASHEQRKGGDCIALCAHVMQTTNYEAAEYLGQQIGLVERNGTVDSNSQLYSSKSQATAPRKQEEETPRASAAASARHKSSSASFDPNAYLTKLAYSDEVAALGISEADAQALGIGWSNSGMHKGIAFALRWETGEIAGFCSVIGGEVKLPKRLIPPTIHVLKRPA